MGDGHDHGHFFGDGHGHYEDLPSHGEPIYYDEPEPVHTGHGGHDHGHSHHGEPAYNQGHYDYDDISYGNVPHGGYWQ